MKTRISEDVALEKLVFEKVLLELTPSRRTGKPKESVRMKTTVAARVFRHSTDVERFVVHHKLVLSPHTPKDRREFKVGMDVEVSAYIRFVSPGLSDIKKKALIGSVVGRFVLERTLAILSPVFKNSVWSQSKFRTLPYSRRQNKRK